MVRWLVKGLEGTNLLIHHKQYFYGNLTDIFVAMIQRFQNDLKTERENHQKQADEQNKVKLKKSCQF